MANLTKDQVLAALPGFSKANLRALQAVITGLLGDTPQGQLKPPNEPLGWLYDALTVHLGARQNYQIFTATVAGKAFIKKAPMVLDFIDKNFPGVLGNKVKAQGLMRYLSGLMVDDLKARKVPITRQTVMVNLHRISEVFEKAYPGYLGSGLGMMVMKSLLTRTGIKDE